MYSTSMHPLLWTTPVSAVMRYETQLFHELSRMFGFVYTAVRSQVLSFTRLSRVLRPFGTGSFPRDMSCHLESLT